ncbi:photosystem I assembly protein ycf4 [Micromonas pusilla CCMP1545]|jgi:hypothetical protein|uniref:Photosystem I assembly protein Ycf4 n=1 Tax=Micromonas pusilla (strain CCMP1545) TaxID=564608 RepID=C1N1T5_MICPC|nr:photosystem I assembly protein ycf4 [Micromonas pusilla CCMP1545]EEH53887.1 photosystem I assembly protein ycf4 [Micromonas pusilla CCMP1545]|eukprot:XP_003062175.1 photosystem I assembly protein ycf4 [Micromonas pusilla CCMP1545]
MSALAAVRGAPAVAARAATAPSASSRRAPAGPRASLPARRAAVAGTPLAMISRGAASRRAASGSRRRVLTRADAVPESEGAGSMFESQFKKVANDSVMIDPVVGAKRFSNYFWAGVVSIGATGFLITGASSYIEHNLLFFLDASEIKFFPQGLVMSFYGVAGSLLATYLWLTINWDVGAGYNEFNKEEGIMRIFRYGFPGNNRRINLVSSLADVQAVRVEISDGVNPRRVVYVRCKGKSDIPLTRIGQPLTLAEVEKQAADLAKFLGVPIEGL